MRLCSWRGEGGGVEAADQSTSHNDSSDYCYSITTRAIRSASLRVSAL